MKWEKLIKCVHKTHIIKKLDILYDLIYHVFFIYFCMCKLQKKKSNVARILAMNEGNWIKRRGPR